jgi:HEAT repeat protein
VVDDLNRATVAAMVSSEIDVATVLRSLDLISKDGLLLPLRAAANDPDSFVRQVAALALGQLGARDQSPPAW